MDPALVDRVEQAVEAAIEIAGAGGRVAETVPWQQRAGPGLSPGRLGVVAEAAMKIITERIRRVESRLTTPCEQGLFTFGLLLDRKRINREPVAHIERLQKKDHVSDIDSTTSVDVHHRGADGRATRTEKMSEQILGISHITTSIGIRIATNRYSSDSLL